MLKTMENAKKPLSIGKTCDWETEKVQKALLREREVIQKPDQ